MVTAPDSIWIPISQAEIGKEYRGYKSLNRPDVNSYCRVEYLGNGEILVFGKEKYSEIFELCRDTTYQEKEEWYIKQFNIDDKKTQLNLLGLFNDMYDVGDAYHEMWNAWVGIDFYEMNARLSGEDFCLVGIAPARWGCNYIDDPIAFVAEEENGTRFWCHGSKKWVEDMRKQMSDVYKDYTKAL